MPDNQRVAFQGEPGAYGEEAILRYFGPTATPTPLASFAAVFQAVASGATDSALVPIENSQAGSINEVYDLLRAHRLYVTGEISLPVNHCLLALPGQQLSDIHRVLSHPQALAQSDTFLRALGAEVIAAYDTAGSAKRIAHERLQGVAAVASERAAQLYGLDILARDIQTVRDNFTRFVALDRMPASVSAHTPAKTMLLLVTAHTPGALYRALGEFAARGVNLLKLESRPSRAQPWEYVFYLDVEGAADSPPVAEALSALTSVAPLTHILGTFPRGAGC